jgi:hypothetical protein
MQDRDEAVSLVDKLEPRGIVIRARLQHALRTERAHVKALIDQDPVRGRELSQSVFETTTEQESRVSNLA